MTFCSAPLAIRKLPRPSYARPLAPRGLPEKITIGKRGANTAATTRDNKTQKTTIVIHHSKYLNNIVEQDHRTVKRFTRPMLGFKSF